MATVSSVNSLKIAIALAERQVQRDQSQVQQDASRLDQSRAQLDRDQRTLGSVQEQSKSAQATTATKPAPRLDRAIQASATSKVVAEPVKAAPAPAKAQVNAQGETIGKLINVRA